MIETVGTVDMERSADQSAGLADTAGKCKGRLSEDSGRGGELPIAGYDRALGRRGNC